MTILRGPEVVLSQSSRILVSPERRTDALTRPLRRARPKSCPVAGWMVRPQKTQLGHVWEIQILIYGINNE